MKTTLNIMLGSLILVSVAGYAAGGNNRVRTDDLVDLPKPKLQLPGGQYSFGDSGTGKTMEGDNQVRTDELMDLPKLKTIDRSTSAKQWPRPVQRLQRAKQQQRSIGETEKNLITKPGW